MNGAYEPKITHCLSPKAPTVGAILANSPMVIAKGNCKLRPVVNDFESHIHSLSLNQRLSNIF